MMDDHEHQNLQRILSSYPAQSMALIGFYITISIAGGTALFALTQADLSDRVLLNWCAALGIVGLFVSVLISAIWYREHALKDSAVSALRDAGIKLPETKGLARLATKLIVTLFVAGVFVWVVLLLVLLFWPDAILNISSVCQ